MPVGDTGNRQCLAAVVWWNMADPTGHGITEQKAPRVWEELYRGQGARGVRPAAARGWRWHALSPSGTGAGWRCGATSGRAPS